MAEEKNKLSGESNNIQLEDNQYNAAFTRGDDLFITLPGGEEIQVTYDGGDGISSGQPDVHRSEFGINKGLKENYEEINNLTFDNLNEFGCFSRPSST